MDYEEALRIYRNIANEVERVLAGAYSPWTPLELMGRLNAAKFDVDAWAWACATCDPIT